MIQKQILSKFFKCIKKVSCIELSIEEITMIDKTHVEVKLVSTFSIVLTLKNVRVVKFID